jgi:omega-amidase
MNPSLSISLVQAPLAWHDPHKNREYFTARLDSGEKSDLWLLPEMFTTGFTMQPAPVAEPVNGETYGWLTRMAIKHRTHIGGSAVTEEGGRYYNRFLLADPEGNITSYDKRHLFTMAGEHEVYSKGEKGLVVSVNGWRISFLVCYDLRFPVFARNNAAQPYDLLVYVANWPVPRIKAWDKLLMARAIENQCYVAGVNRVGTDDNGMEYNGHSACIDPWGEVIAGGGEDEAVIRTVLDKDKLDDFRRKFPVLRDADLFRLD